MSPRKNTAKPAAGKKPVAKKSAAKKSSPAKLTAKKSGGISAAAFNALALAFPGALEKPSYGQPAIFILKKFFTRRRADDNSAVVYVGSIDERDMLLEAAPAVFHITDHYRDYPIVLARLDRIDTATLKGMLERRWQQIAPKKMLK